MTQERTVSEVTTQTESGKRAKSQKSAAWREERRYHVTTSFGESKLAVIAFASSHILNTTVSREQGPSCLLITRPGLSFDHNGHPKLINM